jgi:hypothetical protein
VPFVELNDIRAFPFQASDPDFSDVADFIIVVTDINNNYPVFVFPNKTTVLRFNIFVSLFTFTLQTQINDCRFFCYDHKNSARKEMKEIFTAAPCILTLSSLLLYPNYAQLNCTKRISKSTFKFTLKFSHMFRLNNNHQGATIRALLKLYLLNKQLKHVVMEQVRSFGCIFIPYLLVCLCV